MDEDLIEGLAAALRTGFGVGRDGAVAASEPVPAEGFGEDDGGELVSSFVGGPAGGLGGGSHGEARGEVEDPRDEAILGPALEVFGRFGFRKTSMEGVARAAGVSRQGLYVFFANKEELFRAAVGHALKKRLAAGEAALDRGGVEMGVVGALEEWIYPPRAGAGYDGGLVGVETDALMISVRELAGAVLREYEGRLVAMLAGAIGESEMGAGFARWELTPEEVARALYAMARGVRGSCEGREAFRGEMGVAVRVMWAVGRV